MNVTLEWRDYRYFPYERRFARREVASLFGIDEPGDAPNGLTIPVGAFNPALAHRLTYFARVQTPDGTVLIPHQAKLESGATSSRASRQATRYSAHGLHEYKGKFNPQVVRSIGNMLGLSEAAWVLDPFSGSGTTLLESAHLGWNALGTDRNPLAVEVANAKVSALHHAVQLEPVLAHVEEYLLERLWMQDPAVEFSALQKEVGQTWLGAGPDGEYLQAWFPVPVLAQAAAVRRSLESAEAGPAVAAVFMVMLSDAVRECSLQDPGDLRIRRRKDPSTNYPLIEEFLKRCRTTIPRVVAARCALGETTGFQRAVLVDSRTMVLPNDVHVPRGGFDAAITSPPYATALPYIDTQRLSLVLLGLVSAKDLRPTERELVGARDIGKRERLRLEDEISAGADPRIPYSVVSLCQSMLADSQKPGNGFRRRNKPALVWRYFVDMASCIQAVAGRLKPGGISAMVVGPNRTTLGGTEYEIDTPRLLQDVAVSNGLEAVECVDMDAYHRYSVHQRNSISQEMLVLSRKGS